MTSVVYFALFAPFCGQSFRDKRSGVTPAESVFATEALS